jgi:hypothetical protein
MIQFMFFVTIVGLGLLFLAIVALGVALRRAFVRIDQLEREVRSATTPVPQAVLPPESDLPPKGGSYRAGEALLNYLDTWRYRRVSGAPASWCCWVAGSS